MRSHDREGREVPREETASSYRSCDAWLAARTLLVDAYAGAGEAAHRLSHAALALAMHIVDSTLTGDAAVRQRHLQDSLLAARQLAQEIADAERRGEIGRELAMQMRELQARAEASLERCLGC